MANPREYEVHYITPFANGIANVIVDPAPWGRYAGAELLVSAAADKVQRQLARSTPVSTSEISITYVTPVRRIE